MRLAQIIQSLREGMTKAEGTVATGVAVNQLDSL